MSVLSEARFRDPIAALEHVEAVLWPNGPVCPHCGPNDRLYALKGKSTKPGVRKCGHCKKLFTVTVGTIFESSHIALNKWLQAIHLLCSSKKGISSHQFLRTLEVTYKTAWFMSHRIREAMCDGKLAPPGGVTANAVEADENFIGKKEGVETPKGGYSHKHVVLGLVERGGKVRTIHEDRPTKVFVAGALRDNVDRETRLMTDEARRYRSVGTEFAGHSRVHHTRGEYVDPEDPSIHANTVEGYFSTFKRGMKGIYQHCAEKHLHRYLAEFDFRYNN
jgi:transposase-like protein